MLSIDNALQIALNAHKGQVDRDGVLSTTSFEAFQTDKELTL